MIPCSFFIDYSFKAEQTLDPNSKEATGGEFDPNELPSYTNEEGLKYELSYYFFGAFLEELITQQAL